MRVPKHIVALIDAKNEEILRLEREKAESEHALGFAVEAVERLEAEKAVMLEVLETAKQFISNGIELGYIHLPEEGDAALETPAIIEAAIGKARGEECD